MQFLLSEEEWARVLEEREQRRQMPTLEALINVVKHVACNTIDTNPTNGRQPMTVPAGCRHVPNSFMGKYTPEYCDHCSVSGICPLPKNWSK